MAAADTIMTSRVPYPSNHARTPSTLKFLVSSETMEEDVKDTVNFRRVQELFSVNMSVCSDGEGYDVVSLTGSDADRIEKARCYVMAMSSPQAFCDVQCSQSMAVLLMTQLRGSIERDHLVYLRSSNSANSTASKHLLTSIGSVRVQGMDDHVSAAVSKIRSLIEMVEQQGHSTVDICQTVSNRSEVGSSPYPKPVCLDYFNMKKLEPRADEFGELSYGSGSVPIVGDFARGGKLLLPRDTPDPNLEKRIEYFVKLDFPRERVRSVLESLGPHASENEVMERLMKVTPGIQPVIKPHPSSRRRGTPPGPDVGTDEQEQPPPFVPPPVRKIPVDPSRLRAIVIDGSNVAMRHGNGQVFSCRGIQIAVDYFKERGHDKITVFVPEWRKESSRPENPITDQYLLEKLEKEKHLVYTPSRRLNNGRRIVCYDDRYIVKLAHEEGGVIVSNDQFRDLMQENQEWKKVIEQRLLQFAFASDYFMPPDDPLGKNGPTLDQFLSIDSHDLMTGSKKASSSDRSSVSHSKPVCPHLGNCTFGKKCRYYHPDREPQAQPLKQESTSLNIAKVPGHRTPRSTTPSPGPEGWSSLGRSYSAGKSDRRGQASSHSSTDDLYHHDRHGSGSSGANGENPSGIDISNLAEELERTNLGSPNRKLNYGLERVHQSRANRVVSSPVFSEGVSSSVAEVSRPHNYTFPLAQVPQRDSRGPNVTGDHSYLLNQPPNGNISQGHTHVNQLPPHSSSGVMACHMSRQQYLPIHPMPPADAQQQRVSNQFRPRDPQFPQSQPQFLAQQSAGSAVYPQPAPPPPGGSSAHHGVPRHLPSNIRLGSSDYYSELVTDSAQPHSGLPSHHYQVSPPGHNSIPKYDGRSNPAQSLDVTRQANIAPHLPYSGSHAGLVVDQSDLHPQHYPSSQSHLPERRNYNQSMSGNVPPAGSAFSVGQGYHRDWDSRSGRQDLYGASVTMLPGEHRVRYVLDQHP